MMTKDEAKYALETELRSRKLVKPMTLEQLNVFCGEMYKRLEFKSHRRAAHGHSEMGQGVAV